MTPYARKFFTGEEVAIFNKIKESVDLLPDIDLGKDEQGRQIILSCHVLARAIAKAFYLKVVDGYYLEIYQHSWCVTPQGNIIDVYPIATLGGPILLDGGDFTPASKLYKKKDSRTFSQKVRFTDSSFRRSVRRITKLIIKNLATS